jgi:transposase-like protein
VKFPKATAKITDDRDQLLAFYDYPAEHWVHLRTTNPIVILSLHVSQGCDLWRPVVDSVADGTLAA